MLRGEQKKITNNNMSVCLHLEMQILQETECKIAKGFKINTGNRNKQITLRVNLSKQIISLISGSYVTH